MVLQRARADQFFQEEDEEVPGGIPRHGRDQRPKIRRVDDPTKFAYYRRASSFGERIEESYLLDRHAERQVARGMALNPDLVDLAQAVAGMDERGDKDELTRIANLAKDRIGGNAKANAGTALHKLRERKDAGESLAFVGPKLWAALEAWTALMERFTMHTSEQFVVCDEWQAAGTYDVLLSPKPGYRMVAPDGVVFGPQDRLVGDLKSGAHIDQLGRIARSAQLTVYPNSVPYEHVSDEAAKAGDNGRREWPDGIAPRTDWAIIPHVPLESPEDAALWWVDLTQGRLIAAHAHQREQLRRLDGLFLPAELPELEPAPAPDVLEVYRFPFPGQPGYCRDCEYDKHVCGGCGEPTTHAQGLDCGGHVLDLIDAAESDGELTALWDRFADVWTAEHTSAVRARLSELSSGSTEVRTS